MKDSMFEQVYSAFWSSFKVLLLLTFVCGFCYPLAVTAISQSLFPNQAAGSLTKDKTGNVTGSALIGQKFTTPKYFHSRPSASDFATVPSGASNLSPTSKAFATAVADRAQSWGMPVESVPADLLMASGSGLDPHISLQAALFQVPAVSKARGISKDVLMKLVEANELRPQFIWDNNRLSLVNVLSLNAKLDSGAWAND